MVPCLRRQRSALWPLSSHDHAGTARRVGPENSPSERFHTKPSARTIPLEIHCPCMKSKQLHTEPPALLNSTARLSSTQVSSDLLIPYTLACHIQRSFGPPLTFPLLFFRWSTESKTQVSTLWTGSINTGICFERPKKEIHG